MEPKTMADEKIPPGVSAIFIADGRVIAQASDFNQSRPGGFTTREAQEHRVRTRLAHAVIRELSSPLLANNVDSYMAEQILRAIPGKIYIMPIGSSDSANENQT